MNVRLLVAAAAFAAFGIAGAQAQAPTYGHEQQNNSVRGSAGASGSAHTKKIHPKGSTNGTVGAATGRRGVNTEPPGSAKTPPADIDGNARTGGSMR